MKFAVKYRNVHSGTTIEWMIEARNWMQATQFAHNDCDRDEEIISITWEYPNERKLQSS
jgi:hypothetical protein